MASGEVMNANAKENSDFWVALRGGGNNLGTKSHLTLLHGVCLPSTEKEFVPFVLTN